MLFSNAMKMLSCVDEDDVLKMKTLVIALERKHLNFKWKSTRKFWEMKNQHKPLHESSEDHPFPS